MLDRLRAAEQFRHEVGDRFLLEGWIEGPCAEAADLRGINTLMMDFYDDPAFVQELFEFALQTGLQFARAQVEAGVDLIGVGDAAASLLGPQIYEQYVWSYEKRLVEGLHAMGARVRLHICGNTNSILEGIGRLNCDIVDLDFMVPVADAPSDGRRAGLAGQHRPRARLAGRKSRYHHRRTGPVPSGGRATLHRRSGLRSSTRYVPCQPARDDAIRSRHTP